MLCGVNEASQCYFLLAVYVSRSSEAKERLRCIALKKQAMAGSVQYSVPRNLLFTRCIST